VIEVVAFAALVTALVAAVVRDPRVPEAAVALAGALLLVALGGLDWTATRDEARSLGPTLALLAALLVLGDGCERAGLFDALAERMAAASGGHARRLLALVFAAACAITAVLGLDATVVLLTPAAFAAASRARVPYSPHVYATNHLANSASLLLPVSNLTNLLAFGALGLSFAHFAALMALPWAVAIAIEWIVIGRHFGVALAQRGLTPHKRVTKSGAGDEPAGGGEAARGDRGGTAAGGGEAGGARGSALPRWPVAVLALTLAGFLAASAAGVDLAWPAAAGAAALVLPQRPRIRDVVYAADLPLLVFVLGLGLIVHALVAGSVGDTIADVLPSGDGLLALLGATAVAAVLANLLNNVPALLVLLPAAAAAGDPIVLAVLIGVNVGPNLTYTGSLATLLWRRVLRERGAEPLLGEFLRLGLLTVPATLAGATVALWLAVRAIG
jgi:arsenical pump membrane protein